VEGDDCDDSDDGKRPDEEADVERPGIRPTFDFSSVGNGPSQAVVIQGVVGTNTHGSLRMVVRLHDPPVTTLIGELSSWLVIRES
jgi:hypothetical protein